jgi:ribose 5-phosphate isomerase B
MGTESIRKMAIASDHAGFAYKEMLKDFLEARGITVVDFGTDSDQSADYPLYIRPAAEAVASGDCQAGIVLGGSGNGEAMVANKVHGIRCAVCWNTESARLAREHNNANVISLGQRMMSEEMARNIVDTWLNAEFEGGRHARRISQIESA